MRAIAAAGVLVAVALSGPPHAGASDATLKETLVRWSTEVRFGARGVGLSARRHHPIRMTTKARGFRREAVAAQRALRAQRPGTERGRRAKSLAIAAFHDYAVVGSEWALSGVARQQRKAQAARMHALRASRFARAGSVLLARATVLLR
jgi:hypothetical protein